MAELRRVALLPLAALLAVACAAPATPPDGVSGSSELARSAVHAALEGGAFEALLEQAVASSFGAARSQFASRGRSLTTEQTRELEASLRKVFEEVYPREAWEEALVPVYLDAFDRSELEEVLAFQRTPLGAKLLAAQARLATGGGPIGQRLIQSRQTEFTRRLSEELTALWGARGPE